MAALRQQQKAGLPLPAELVMDQAGGAGKTRARVASFTDGQTRMVARVPQGGGSDLSRFGVADFVVDGERSRCTCPNGVVSTKASRSGDGDGVHFRFYICPCRQRR